MVTTAPSLSVRPAVPVQTRERRCGSASTPANRLYTPAFRQCQWNRFHRRASGGAHPLDDLGAGRGFGRASGGAHPLDDLGAGRGFGRASGGAHSLDDLGAGRGFGEPPGRARNAARSGDGRRQVGVGLSAAGAPVGTGTAGGRGGTAGQAAAGTGATASASGVRTARVNHQVDSSTPDTVTTAVIAAFDST